MAMGKKPNFHTVNVPQPQNPNPNPNPTSKPNANPNPNQSQNQNLNLKQTPNVAPNSMQQAPPQQAMASMEATT